VFVENVHFTDIYIVKNECIGFHYLLNATRVLVSMPGQWYVTHCGVCVCADVYSTPPSKRDRRLRDSGFFPKTLEACSALLLNIFNFFSRISI